MGGPFAFYLFSALAMVLGVAIGWILVGLLHLSGTIETVLRTLFVGMAFAAFGALAQYRSRKEQRKAQEAAGGQADVGAAEKEVEVVVRDAQIRLAQSSFGQALGRDGKLTELPVFFLVGESAAAKTSAFVNSGVEPELLAGQVYQDTAIIPTRPVNFWLAQKSVFVEAGGRLIGDPGRWTTLVKKLHPKRRWWRVFGRKPLAPRAVIVCVDSEAFLKPNAEESLALTARALRTRLGEISQLLAIRLPLYVLFTKLDRLAYFIDFVGNLSDEETTQVLGVTLPLRGDREQGGVYAEEESRILTAAFDELFHSLCDKRPPFLARENDANKLPPVYEFPREFRKLRNSAVRFLVDLGRPSQLRANPFLRGFYFSGVRPVTVKESAPAARVAASQMKRAATGLFGPGGVEDPLADPSTPARTRRVPQWLFLGHLFSDVLLRDRAAMGASGQSIRSELMRRILAGSVAGLFLLWGIALTVSYIGNRNLEKRVSEAALGIRGSDPGGAAQELPPVAALERLDTLRDVTYTLSKYHREGAPWSLRWGLYVGNDLYVPTRRLYFARFRQLLFGATQQALLDYMSTLPAHPDPSREYQPTYDTLKAYLMTTKNPEKATHEFLVPALMNRWAKGRDVGSDRWELARRQFDFYTDELLIDDPFPSDGDQNSIAWARAYLWQFNQFDRLYASLIADASTNNKPVNFNKSYPGSSDYVANDKEVAGAFSKDGWRYIHDKLKAPKNIAEADWVLGPRPKDLASDPANLVQQLLDRYHQDFLGNWRKYLHDSEVVKFGSLADASKKLTQLSSQGSYLLAMFCLASENTSVAADLAAPYQPVQWVTPPGCTSQFASANNSEYLAALVRLKDSVGNVVKASGSDVQSAAEQTATAAADAHQVVNKVANNFHFDPMNRDVDGRTKVLLEEPITQVEALLGRIGPQQLNSQGASLCSQFADLVKKYPFLTSSPQDATIDEINRIFRPGDGKLTVFYDGTLKNYLDRQGNRYVRKPDSKVHITDRFLEFFNHAMGFSDAIYKGGGKDPDLKYIMKAQPFEVLKSLTLSIDGTTLKATPNGGQSQEFTWPGTSTHGAKLSGAVGSEEVDFNTQEGLWAAFRFFGDSDQFDQSGNTYSLVWIPKSGQSKQPAKIGGKVIKLPFQLDLKGAPPIFKRDYLNGFGCVSDVAR